ncbi:protein of unknown function [Methylococcus capsulatus]|uniref:Uncharacterized protein n=1 Tax=Methylococcus capsulatus TaxID=414 RepID=A0AA35XZW3_METCP|nr:protein of unknown function [Methylococcus capsulatus]
MARLDAHTSRRLPAPGGNESRKTLRSLLPHWAAAGIGLGAIVLGASGHADTSGAYYESFGDFLRQTKFHGNLRSYYFSRTYTGEATNQYAYSLGGYAGLLTAPLYHFQAGLTLGAGKQPRSQPGQSGRGRYNPAGRHRLGTDRSVPAIQTRVFDLARAGPDSGHALDKPVRFAHKTVGIPRFLW